GKIGNKISRMRRRFGGDDEDDDRRGRGLPTLVRAALENLREVAGERLEADADAEAKLVEILARAPQERKKAGSCLSLRGVRSTPKQSLPSMHAQQRLLRFARNDT